MDSLNFTIDEFARELGRADGVSDVHGTEYNPAAPFTGQSVTFTVAGKEFHAEFGSGDTWDYIYVSPVDGFGDTLPECVGDMGASEAAAIVVVDATAMAEEWSD